MSTPFPNLRQQKAEAVDWARLIPGEMPGATGKRKPPRSVRPEPEFTSEKVSEISTGARSSRAGNALVSLVPCPLQGRMAWGWLRATVADFALVGLNWLLLGALLVPLQSTFPRISQFGFAVGPPVALLGIAVLHAALITLLGYTEALYAEACDLPEQARVLGKSVLWATILLCVTLCLQGSPWLTSGLFCGAGLLHFGALLAWRWQDGRQKLGEPDGGKVRNVLIVGAGGVGRRVASHMEAHPEGGRRVYGFLDNERPLGNGVVGRVGDLARLARMGFVDAVILAAPHDRRLTLQVVHEARRLRLDAEMVPDLFGFGPAGTGFDRVGDLPVICLHAEPVPAAGLAFKRLVDVIGAGIAMLALWPLMLLISCLIKLDSPGPFLYCAQRAGRKGRLFRCYKFRTMVGHADQLKNNLWRSNQRTGPFFKIASDPRITRLGRVLRRYSLDELPQLWNVLKGEMSLVGPRPHPLDEFAGYELGHMGRLDVTPGMTGLWQVMARRDPSFDRLMELDREYIRTWSLRLDMRILLKTFVTVVHGSGD